MTERIVLAYSGGLDTSVAIPWIKERTGREVIALAIDVGQAGEDLEQIRQRAIDCGAVEAVVVDARDEFANDYLVPALQANAMYQRRYPLVSALSRPLIARHLARTARELGANSIAHGCTGMGNDQVRFEAAVAALAPELTSIAPIRDLSLTRDVAISTRASTTCPSASRRRRRTRSTRTSGAARLRPASSKTRGTRPSKTSMSTRRTRRSTVLRPRSPSRLSRAPWCRSMASV